MAVLKKVLSPVQSRMMSFGLCPACFTPFSKLTRYAWGEGKGILVCKCGRVFIYDRETKKYHRAEMSEAEQFFHSQLKKID